MPEVSVKVEQQLREMILDIADREGKTIKDTGSMLVEVGNRVKEAGEPEISGPFGISRPFSKIDLGGPKSEIKIDVDDDEFEKASTLFDGRTKTEFTRQALRLGVIVESDEKLEIEGPGGVVRPFADIDVDS